MGDVVEVYACVPLMSILALRGRTLVSSGKCCTELGGAPLFGAALRSAAPKVWSGSGSAAPFSHLERERERRSIFRWSGRQFSAPRSRSCKIPNYRYSCVYFFLITYNFQFSSYFR